MVLRVVCCIAAASTVASAPPAPRPSANDPILLIDDDHSRELQLDLRGPWADGSDAFPSPAPKPTKAWWRANYVKSPPPPPLHGHFKHNPRSAWKGPESWTSVAHSGHARGPGIIEDEFDTSLASAPETGSEPSSLRTAAAADGNTTLVLQAVVAMAIVVVLAACCAYHRGQGRKGPPQQAHGGQELYGVPGVPGLGSAAAATAQSASVSGDAWSLNDAAKQAASGVAFADVVAPLDVSAIPEQQGEAGREQGAKTGARVAI